MKNKILYFIFYFLLSMDTKAQCAMCRAVLENQVGHGSAKGINDGILYLMTIPYVLVFGIGYFVYRKYFKPK